MAFIMSSSPRVKFGTTYHQLHEEPVKEEGMNVSFLSGRNRLAE
jgi:hypothetical protein